MRCQKCGKKIRRRAYKWLGTIYCHKCFEEERSKKMWDFSVEWDYELIDVKEHKISSIRKLTEFFSGGEDEE